MDRGGQVVPAAEMASFVCFDGFHLLRGKTLQDAFRQKQHGAPGTHQPRLQQVGDAFTGSGGAVETSRAPRTIASRRAQRISHRPDSATKPQNHKPKEEARHVAGCDADVTTAECASEKGWATVTMR